MGMTMILQFLYFHSVGVGMVIKSRCNGKRRFENMVMRACRPSRLLKSPSGVKGQSPCSGSQRPMQPPWSWKILSFRTSTGSSTGTLPIYIYSKTLIMGEVAAWSADAWIRHCLVYYILTVTYQRAACDAASVHFGLTIRYDIFTCAQKLTKWPA